MTTEEFAHECLKISAAQVCTQHTFTNIESSALETMADLIKLFVTKIGEKSHFCAELAGRTQSNYHDIQWSIEELGFYSIEELLRFANQSDCPWARESVAAFSYRQIIPGTIRGPAEALPDYAPSFLPAFPDKRTYIKTPSYNESAMDAKTVRQSKAQQRTEAENNLARLHTREVGSHHINYDQVFDPKTAQTVKGPFQAPKDPAEMVAENQVEIVPPSVSPTVVPQSRVNMLVDSNSHTHVASSYGPISSFSHDPSKDRLQAILSLNHTDNHIHKLSED